MVKRLNVKAEDIYKLKIICVLKSGLIVKQKDGKEGFIHISEISDGFVDNIKESFKPGMYVYGVLTISKDDRYNFSLKRGHTIPKEIRKKHYIYETNGGYLSIVYNMEKFLNIE